MLTIVIENCNSIFFKIFFYFYKKQTYYFFLLIVNLSLFYIPDYQEFFILQINGTFFIYFLKSLYFDLKNFIILFNTFMFLWVYMTQNIDLIYFIFCRLIKKHFKKIMHSITFLLFPLLFICKIR